MDVRRCPAVGKSLVRREKNATRTAQCMITSEALLNGE